MSVYRMDEGVIERYTEYKDTSDSLVPRIIFRNADVTRFHIKDTYGSGWMNEGGGGCNGSEDLVKRSSVGRREHWGNRRIAEKVRYLKIKTAANSAVKTEKYLGRWQRTERLVVQKVVS